MWHVSVGVRMDTYLNTYPRRTPFSWGSGGGCHWTIMDWLVRPLATIFFGGALGGSSLSINLIHTIRERIGKFPGVRASVWLMSGVCPASHISFSMINYFARRSKSQAVCTQVIPSLTQDQALKMIIPHLQQP